MFKKYQLRYYNFRLVVIVLVTAIFGILVVNSADASYTLKMCFGVASGFVLMIVISFIDYNWILKFYWGIYLLNIVLLLIVQFFGKSSGGATRWIKITDSLTIQPSEFAKIFLILFTAKLISVYKDKLNDWKFLSILALLFALPIGLILAQPNLSTSILICLILISVIYCAGLNYRIIGIVLAVVIPLTFFSLIYIQNPNQQLIKSYQRDRIMAFIDPENYDDNVYQQHYSVQAIGSGMLNGKGLNNEDASSVKNAGYIAEAQTDFIFAVVGEELGFIGGTVVLLLLAMIILECIISAIRADNFAGRLISCGMASLISFQSFINIGVATQLLPNTGLPLPFISYGLSSAWALLWEWESY